ncbi:hypothetical protein BK025_02355 [Sodalis sp. TME1]|nr:hypothetical protein BK025_02355 [Sodalis sp. TME1]
MEPDLTAIMRLVERNAERLLEEAVAIATIPAPSFNEAKRGAHIARRFSEVGLTDVASDEIGNVTGRRAGNGPRVMVVSHMDTVFPLEPPCNRVSRAIASIVPVFGITPPRWRI